MATHAGRGARTSYSTVLSASRARGWAWRATQRRLLGQWELLPPPSGHGGASGGGSGGAVGAVRLRGGAARLRCLTRAPAFGAGLGRAAGCCRASSEQGDTGLVIEGVARSRVSFQTIARPFSFDPQLRCSALRPLGIPASGGPQQGAAAWHLPATSTVADRPNQRPGRPACRQTRRNLRPPRPACSLRASDRTWQRVRVHPKRYQGHRQPHPLSGVPLSSSRALQLGAALVNRAASAPIAISAGETLPRQLRHRPPPPLQPPLALHPLLAPLLAGTMPSNVKLLMICGGALLALACWGKGRSFVAQCSCAAASSSMKQRRSAQLLRCGGKPPCLPCWPQPDTLLLQIPHAQTSWRTMRPWFPSRRCKCWDSG